MKKFIAWLVNPIAKDYSDNTGYVFKRTITWIAGVTLIIFLLLLILLSCNRITGTITFLSVACASLAGGAAVGFLFGLPRAEKYRFINKDSVDHNAKDYSYGDNTNLEDVSDWITKIIVGLTLIKFNTIIGWLNQSAHSIQNVFANGSGKFHPNFYVFGYSIIVFYFLAGGGLCYLWARTNLSLILTTFKKEQQRLNEKQSALITQIQALNNPELNVNTPAVSNSQTGTFENMRLSAEFPTDNFKNAIEIAYNAKPVIDKSDLQRGRWGGLAKKGDNVLEAEYIKGASAIGPYKINLKVRSLNPDKPISGEVAFFLHDTFPSEIVYSLANNNVANITIVACEAFVTGVRFADGTELELDLNQVKGFPEGFYWK
jgi:hypothetical protein